jgi:dimethylhistidine N-methyltransferase
MPWYRIARGETALLCRHGREILGAVGSLRQIVELGSGSGAKLTTLLQTFAHARPHLDVHLVDGSSAAIAASTQALSGLARVDVVPHQSSYEAGLADAMEHANGRRTLVLCLGSNIGNFDPPQSAVFLAAVRQALADGDALLLGVDLVKSERDLVLAYDDPLGVTAAFNRNLLARMNRELGADFNLKRFAHHVVWREREARVEMHLVSMDRQRVRVPAAGVDLTLEADESIWTESSYKFTADDVLARLEQAGFTPVRQWIEQPQGVVLTLARAGAG